MAIIGLSGYGKSGKSTVAELIKEIDYSWHITGFSYPLKKAASILTGIPTADLDKQEVKSRILGDEWDSWGYKGRNDGTYVEPYFTGEPYRKSMTVRMLLQQLGTEAVRNNVHEDAWVNALLKDYYPEGSKQKLFPGVNIERAPSKWIITDVRFPNELSAIQKRGGIVIRVNRLGYKPINSHPSETALDHFAFSHYINNDGSMDDLRNQVKELYETRIKRSLPVLS